ncbi:hypothetical protein [Anaerotignum propionicum]|jgi:hypothetical protein|uniref:hypothetical protein n=1 Tax=Anaerotignum propionicum TaxID=28446 RepID=UPI00289AF498|nr:hypothetical protein [Anaerotignum propionicum]
MILVSTKGKVRNPIFRDYYDRKLAEVKNAKLVLVSIARRLVNIIYGMLKNKTEYRLPSIETVEEANEYQKKSPIEIPKGASYKAQSKTGYEQISYKWNDGTYKYESRWHTRTPGAPETQGNTWVIQRTKPGNAGTKPYTEFFSDDDWVPATKWYDAIAARKARTATAEQIEILDKGHWEE